MHLQDTDSFLIVGTEVEGLFTALFLKDNFPNKLTTILDIVPFQNRTLCVNSGFEIYNLADRLGVDFFDFIKKTNATFCGGDYYQGFSKNDFFNHTTSRPYLLKHNDHYVMYSYILGYRSNPSPYMNPDFFLESKLPIKMDDVGISLNFEYKALRKYLLDLCKEKGISIIQDKLSKVVYNKKKDVSEIIGEQAYYSADIYIDNSGPRRALSKNFEWESWQSYSPLAGSVQFETEKTKEYNLFNLVKCCDESILIRTNLQDKTYNTLLVSKKASSMVPEHIEKIFKKKILLNDAVRSFYNGFPCGCYTQMWKNNVVLIGQSSNYCEPFGSIRIMQGILQTNSFINALPSMDRESCNEDHTYLMNNILSYIGIHYEAKDKWFSNLETPDFLKKHLPLWKKRCPRDRDFSPFRLNLFGAESFIKMVAGLGLFEKSKYHKEIRHYSFSLRASVSRQLKSIKNWEHNCFKISHKEYIRIIKEEFKKKGVIY